METAAISEAPPRWVCPIVGLYVPEGTDFLLLKTYSRFSSTIVEIRLKKLSPSDAERISNMAAGLRLSVLETYDFVTCLEMNAPDFLGGAATVERQMMVQSVAWAISLWVPRISIPHAILMGGAEIAIPGRPVTQTRPYPESIEEPAAYTGEHCDLDPAVLPDIGGALQAILENHDELALALYRYYRGNRERGVNGIVDFVISLEAMLGRDSGEGDVSYRVATRAAILLGGDDDQRLQTITRVKHLYNLRSKLVHGAPKREVEAALKKFENSITKAWERARETTCRVIDALLHRPDLLVKDSLLAMSVRGVPAPPGDEGPSTEG